MLLIAAALVALVFILNKWLFGPLNTILAQRQSEIDTAQSEFDEARRLQDERLAKIEARVADSRKEAYAIREAAHGAGREQREEILTAARDDAAKQIEAARDEIGQQIDDRPAPSSRARPIRSPSRSPREC